MPLKFDDCVSCRHKRTRTCNECDFGEFFEDADSVRELSFDDEVAFSRTSKSLVTEDDEPDHSPDDFVARVEEAEETEEADSE